MNILQSLLKISSITILSRILGFIRDSIVARIFGTSIDIDAFFVAFKFPNTLRRIFAEGSFSQSFIPILIEYKNIYKEKKIHEFISSISGLLILILILITIIGIITAPLIIKIIAPGFTYISKKFFLTIKLLRITFPYIFFISLSSLAGAILNTWNYFAVPAFAPALLNISIISLLLILTLYFNISVVFLAWGIIIGGILQLGYQLPYLKKINMLILPRFYFYDIGVWRVLSLMGKYIIGVSANQISIIINTIFSSFLSSGSISWMYYADRLIEFPSGVLGSALGTILLPLLSRSISNKNYDEYSKLLDWGLRLCLILTLPSAIILGILSRPLIITLFQYGNFSSFDTLMTQNALIAYSIGLTGIILVKVLITAFYARCNTKIPIKTSIIVLIATQCMNVLFITPLKHVGLSLSIGLASYLNAGLLYWYLYSKKIFKPQIGWTKFLFKLLLAICIISITLIGLLTIIPNWTQENMLYRFLYLILTVISGSISYFITLWIVGFRIKNFNKT